ncbi:MAG: glutaminyl-peptide cyclotransferase, partial [Candidatus Sumerlaeota bacterium]
KAQKAGAKPRRKSRETAKPKKQPGQISMIIGLAGVVTLLAFFIGLGILDRFESDAPVLHYEIVKKYPHDIKAYTQGLLVHDGYFYESTGQRGESTLRKVEIETGKVVQSVALEDEYFGEGLALIGDKLYMLTWESGKGFVFSLDKFEKIGEFHYEGEGWGLTSNGKQLIMSDGGHTLEYRDPENFQVQKTVRVKDGLSPVFKINELEYVHGYVYANIWTEDRIAQIDPDTGKVEAWVDMQGLLTPDEKTAREVDVLNGIAYDAEKERFFVTGKNWPWVFEIKIKK